MLSLIYGLFMSAWRRCFGSDGWNLPILKHRVIQHIIGFVAACLVFWWLDYSWVQIVLAALVLQGLFWARSHGCCFDYGHGTVDVKRYDQLWYWKYIKKFIPEKQWYGYNGDFFLMFVRYTLPSLLLGLILFSLPACFLGLALSGVYAIMWLAYDFGWTKSPTATAEWIAGFVVGVLLTL